jgi:hypothetical protein
LGFDPRLRGPCTTHQREKDKATVQLYTTTRYDGVTCEVILNIENMSPTKMKIYGIIEFE